jgi:hypothetical protein
MRTQNRMKGDFRIHLSASLFLSTKFPHTELCP